MNLRRDVLKLGLLGSTLLNSSGAFSATREKPSAPPRSTDSEGRRIADQGNGYFLNPLFAGDFPDPTILKDGADYYMAFTPFEAAPALLIWHSLDLINWQPLAPALFNPPGNIYAVDLCKHNDRYYIYLPAVPNALSNGAKKDAIYVIWADNIRGPWSEPIPLNIFGHIDPGHVVGEDGKRYLFLSGVSRVLLADDGLSTAGPVEHVYDGWKYPEEWLTECYALEGPKLMRHGNWFYLISAVGGTAGPATGHMVIAARSRSVHGPWENCPHNPIVRTRDESEKWWSRGHATLVEGPAGDWWMVYHGYENGFRTLGRQTLLDPIVWTADGWFKSAGGDLSKPLRKPRGGKAVTHGMALSDDFSRNMLGTKWSFYKPGRDEVARVNYEENALVLRGKGSDPTNCSPLTCVAGDHSYECTVQVEIDGDAQGGLLLFYSTRLFCGIGYDGAKTTIYRSGEVLYSAPLGAQGAASRRLHLRVVNQRHVVSLFHSQDGVKWSLVGIRFETSGYNHNTVGEFISLRPALYAAGGGQARFCDFRYRALS